MLAGQSKCTAPTHSSSIGHLYFFCTSLRASSQSHSIRFFILLFRSSVKHATEQKLQHAKEMKAKASAYADAASPVKRPGTTKSPEAMLPKTSTAPPALPKSTMRLPSSTILFFCDLLPLTYIV